MKAIVLLSGGLDSTLAANLIKKLGIEICILNMKTPFCLCDKKSANGCLSASAKIAKELGAEFKMIYATDEYFAIVKNPKHGYGSNINPCIDCRIFLFRKAKALMQELGASFVVTGEVLGQRPMSQKLDTMRLIEKEAGLEGLILRPLSAKILAPTKAEKEGWIKREDFLAIAGRGRKEQIALAKQLGVNDYPCPSGGCLLTDPSFSRRMKDLLKYLDLNFKEAQLLKLGRHFRVNPKLKLIVGRNEKENSDLLTLAEQEDIYLEPKDLPGPTVLARGNLTQADKALASQILAYYTTKEKEIEVIIKTVGKEQIEITSTSALAEEKLKELLI